MVHDWAVMMGLSRFFFRFCCFSLPPSFLFSIAAQQLPRWQAGGRGRDTAQGLENEGWLQVPCSLGLQKRWGLLVECFRMTFKLMSFWLST